MMDYNCSDKIYFNKKEDPLIISDDIVNSEQALFNNAIVNDKTLFNKTDALKLEKFLQSESSLERREKIARRTTGAKG
jgi:hypothetical protein